MIHASRSHPYWQIVHQDHMGELALRAYFRLRGGEADQPDRPEVVKLRGKQYVILRNVRGVLAVYRVYATGQLREVAASEIE